MNLPALIPVPRVKDVLGIPRTTAYRLAAEGRLRMVKIESSSFITGESAAAFLASLPIAQLSPAKAAA